MNKQIYEEATNWLLKSRDDDLTPGEKREFDIWLRESPKHVEAYLEMSSLWEDVAALNPNWNANATELIAAARTEANIVPLERSATDGGQTRHPHASGDPVKQPRAQRAPKLFAIAATLLLAIAGLGTWAYLQRNTYTTGIGQQQSIALEDGTLIELNARSKIRIDYQPRERHVDLIQGQALFKVAKDHTRPFIVRIDGNDVRAVGTQFDIYRKRDATTVTVLEGRVAVAQSSRQLPADPAKIAARSAPLPLAPGETLLTAGEQLVLARTEEPAKAAPKPTPKPANVEAATAWTQHSLVFDNTPLTEVAQEFNRYNKRQLVIRNAELSTFHVSGVFSSVDPQLLLRFLRTQPELRIEETASEIRISSTRDTEQTSKAL